METIRYLKVNGVLQRLKIERDDEPMNPRTDFDNLCHMVCFHSRYDIGDEHSYENEEEFFMEFCLKHLSKEQINSLVENCSKDFKIVAPIREMPNKEKMEANVIDILSKYNELIALASNLNLSEEATRLCNTQNYIKTKLNDEYEKDFKEATEYKVAFKNKWEYIGTKEACETYLKETLEELRDGQVFYAYYGMYKEAMEMLNSDSDVHISPVSLYDHSGITMYLGSDKGWDCGTVGWIYADKKDFEHKENWREDAFECIKEEVKTYDQYLTGDVYGYIVEEYREEDDDWEEIDSCWGFFGDNIEANGMLDSIGLEWKNATDDIEKVR